MNVLITYMSQTGNTRKIAEAIHREMSGSFSADIKPLDSVTSEELTGYGLIFVGSPCHAGDLANDVKAFLGGIEKNPPYKIAGFITHAAPLYGKKDFEKCQVSFESISNLKNAAFVGFFHCQGFLTETLHRMIKESRNLDNDEWKKMVSNMEGHPDEEDVNRAEEFAREMLSKVK